MMPLVTITQVRPKGPSVVAQLGDGFVVPTADAGWEVVNRPKRKGYTSWAGYSPITMPIPILLDGFTTDTSVEDQIAALFGMMRTIDTATDQPPVVQVAGPVPYANLSWVINGIDPGDEIRRSSDGRRVRAFMTLNLLEYVAADVLVAIKKSPAKAAQARKAKSSKKASKPTTSKRTYRVKKGDTLSAIAARYLGSASKWHQIASLNGIRDPRKLQIGQLLRLP